MEVFGIHIVQKFDRIFKTSSPSEILRFLYSNDDLCASGVSILVQNVDENLMLKGFEVRHAYRHRFLMDFGGFGMPCWHPRGHENLSKMEHENH